MSSSKDTDPLRDTSSSSSSTAVSSVSVSSSSPMLVRLSYWERVKDMMNVCGPPSWPALFANHEELELAHRMVQSSNTDTSNLSSSSSSSLPLSITMERAIYLDRTSYHPDTGKLIPLPFRMAAHVPVNALLLVGMLSSRTVFFTGLWQCLNQCFNAGQFFANRNATNHINDTTLIQAFSAAVISSVAVGSGLRSLALRSEARINQLIETANARVASDIQTMKGSSSSNFLSSKNHHPLYQQKLKYLQIFAFSVPFLGAAAGKPLQIGLMRKDELLDGIDVRDYEGNVLGKSKIAGQAAVSMTIATRIIYLAPMLWMPFVQTALENKFTILRTNRPLGILSYTLHAAINSAFVTPLCIALFDQNAALPMRVMEKSFHSLRDNNGKELDYVFFNKGL